MSERGQRRCEWQLIQAPWRCENQATVALGGKFLCDGHAGISPLGSPPTIQRGERMSEPAAECELGYTRQQVERIVGTGRLDAFDHWMRGQTVGLCEGRLYNHSTRDYEQSCGGVAHGTAYYVSDVRRFLAGLPVID